MMAVAAVASLLTACGDDNEDTLKGYREWMNKNVAWLTEQERAVDPATGEKMYVKVIPDYNRGNYVLMRWYNDQEETKGNLRPYFTSTVDVKYKGRLYDDVPFDSSYLLADSTFQTRLGNVIEGWQIALQQMRVGDSCEVIIPYQVGYGSTGSGKIPPFSVLKFDMKLKNIANYVTN